MRTKNLSKYFILALPTILFFSNFPLISLGETDTMHLEISLPEIWLVLFALLSLGNLKGLVKFYRGKTLILLSLFPLYATISLLWTPNFLRGFLTAGLIWLVIFAALNIFYLVKTLKNPRLPREIILSLLIPSLIVSVYCWFQCFLDLAGVPRENSLLCLGCVSTTFGFPHPNGFAIEPQFMGNLLLAPALLSLFLLARDKAKNLCLPLLSFFFIATLFLTFSRGAIYAFLLAASLLVILLFRKSRRSLLTFPIIIVSFIFTLCTQGIFAELSPTSDTFVTGVTKSIHHLSLGLIDFRPTIPSSSKGELEGFSSEYKSVTQPESQSDPARSASEEKPSGSPSTFSGYVPESTNVRLSFTDYAFDVWNDSPKNLFFGTGLGSAGSVIFEKHPEISSPKEIVQNEYASLLLELGLTAYLALLIELVFIAKAVKRNYKSFGYAQRGSASLSARTPVALAPWDANCRRQTGVLDAPKGFIIALVTAYAITLCFFSGLQNALHIYLIPPLLCVTSEYFSNPRVRGPRGHKQN